jgi:hypothetical protein
MEPKAPAYTLPPETTEVADLLVERLDEVGLAPDTPVICINRGRKVLQETFNARHVQIPPGHFRTEYGAALHFQKRLIVPGTRNLEQGGYVSFIGILGSENGRNKVDDESRCVPFTDVELQKCGEQVEGLDRSALDGSARDVKLIPTSIARASSRNQGASLRPQISASEQASPGALEAADHVFEPPAESDTRAAEQELVAASAPERPAPRTPRAR